jgi:internalin A
VNDCLEGIAIEETLVTQRWWRISRLRLSLRALMIIVLALGCGLGWVVRRAHVQRDAVAAIERCGGRVWYDWEVRRSRVQADGEYIGGISRKKSVSRWPKWLVDRLGPDYFGDVVQVQVGGKDPDAVMTRVAKLSRLEQLNFTLDVPVSDAGIKSVRELTALKSFGVPIRGGKLTGASLENLKGLTELREILLTSVPVMNDADLVHLKGLAGLQHLQLSASPKNVITDAGLANIEDMVDMRQLTMTRAQVTSAGLNHLRGMTRLHDLKIPASRVDDLAPIRHLTGLKFIHLSNTPITDAGLAPVAGFTSLTDLFLVDTPITDAGLKHLRGLTSLAQLELSGTRITDGGLSDLAGLTSLRILGVARTGVTDAGLAHLGKLASLSNLNLAKTQVTDAGLQHLAGLASLSTLNLGDTRVTDAGLKHLAGLKNLNRLTIQGSTITPAAIDALQNTMPDLRVLPPRFGP